MALYLTVTSGLLGLKLLLNNMFGARFEHIVGQVALIVGNFSFHSGRIKGGGYLFNSL